VFLIHIISRLNLFLCKGRINDRTKDKVKNSPLISLISNERNSRYILPVFAKREQKTQEVEDVESSNTFVSDNLIENAVRTKSIPPEKPPRSKPEDQRTRNTVEGEITKITPNTKASHDSELNANNVIDILKPPYIFVESEDQIFEQDKRVSASSSTSTLSSRDNNLPIRSLPGPPITERPLRPSLSCYPDIAPVGAKNEEFHKDSLHRRVGYRMARSSSRLFSACISGQKDIEEESTMRLRRSTSEGKVGKDKKNEARTIKSRSVHFDGNEEGKYVTY
jgi:hypothetical protein